MIFVCEDVFFRFINIINREEKNKFVDQNG